MWKLAVVEYWVPGTVADGAPIVPISAQLKYNIDVIPRTVPLVFHCSRRWPDPMAGGL